MAKQVNPYPFMSPEWYKWTFECGLHGHMIFKQWALEHRGQFDGGVMEIGCGKYEDYTLFFRLYPYIGVDADYEVVRHCERQHHKEESHYWLWADIMDDDLPSADLVFSHAVIDHAKNPEAFLLQCLKYSRRWVYIMAYCGYLSQLQSHEQRQNPVDRYWYNRLSVPRIGAFLGSLPLKSFQCKCVPMHRPPEEIQDELHITIEK